MKIELNYLVKLRYNVQVYFQNNNHNNQIDSFHIINPFFIFFLKASPFFALLNCLKKPPNYLNYLSIKELRSNKLGRSEKLVTMIHQIKFELKLTLFPYLIVLHKFQSIHIFLSLVLLCFLFLASHAIFFFLSYLPKAH